MNENNIKSLNIKLSPKNKENIILAINTFDKMHPKRVSDFEKSIGNDDTRNKILISLKKKENQKENKYFTSEEKQKPVKENKKSEIEIKPLISNSNKKSPIISKEKPKIQKTDFDSDQQKEKSIEKNIFLILNLIFKKFEEINKKNQNSYRKQSIETLLIEDKRDFLSKIQQEIIKSYELLKSYKKTQEIIIDSFKTFEKLNSLENSKLNFTKPMLETMKNLKEEILDFIELKRKELEPEFDKKSGKKIRKKSILKETPKKDSKNDNITFEKIILKKNNEISSKKIEINKKNNPNLTDKKSENMIKKSIDLTSQKIKNLNSSKKINNIEKEEKSPKLEKTLMKSLLLNKNDRKNEKSVNYSDYSSRNSHQYLPKGKLNKAESLSLDERSITKKKESKKEKKEKIFEDLLNLENEINGLIDEDKKMKEKKITKKNIIQKKENNINKKNINEDKNQAKLKSKSEKKIIFNSKMIVKTESSEISEKKENIKRSFIEKNKEIQPKILKNNKENKKIENSKIKTLRTSSSCNKNITLKSNVKKNKVNEKSKTNVLKKNNNLSKSPENFKNIQKKERNLKTAPNLSNKKNKIPVFSNKSKKNSMNNEVKIPETVLKNITNKFENNSNLIEKKIIQNDPIQNNQTIEKNQEKEIEDFLDNSLETKKFKKYDSILNKASEASVILDQILLENEERLKMSASEEKLIN